MKKLSTGVTLLAYIAILLSSSRVDSEIQQAI